MPRTLIKYFHTIKYLRVKQVLYQVYYRCYKVSPKFLVVKTLPVRGWDSMWSAPGLPTQIFIAEDEVMILNQRVELNKFIPWNDIGLPKLWLYHLHSFDILNAQQSDLHAKNLNFLIEHWICNNPPCIGNGWEPYTLSLRIVNWIKWFVRYPSYVTDKWQNSLLLQIEALFKQLEYHILANHLFVNAKALIFAGSYYTGKRANQYLQKGLKIIDSEIKEQFLDDGGHFELSPMYHALLMMDLCDLVNLAQKTSLPALLKRQTTWKLLIEKGLTWLKSMLHPDLQLSFFNDATFGVAPQFDDLINYALQLGCLVPVDEPSLLTAFLLKNSGYCAVNLADASKAILDLGPIGPNYQPGHAHADTLSFELSLYQQRFIVNSGISTYATDAKRQFQRSTAAHNTVNINGENSSEIWAGFRVARRAKPKDLSILQKADELNICCAHDGYTRLKNGNIHRRQWSFTHKKLIMRDTITNDFDDAIMRLYFHPEVKVIVEKNKVNCRLPTGQMVFIEISGAQSILLESTRWYPSFGLERENCCLAVTLNGNELLTQMDW